MYSELNKVSRSVPLPNLRPFDLEVGDRVTYKANRDEDSIRRSIFDREGWNMWKVESISRHIFTCKNKSGIRTSFQKKDYRIGWVVKL